MLSASAVYSPLLGLNYQIAKYTNRSKEKFSASRINPDKTAPMNKQRNTLHLSEFSQHFLDTAPGKVMDVFGCQGPVWLFDQLFREEGAFSLAFHWFVRCVVSVVVCFLFLLVSMVGYVL